MVAELLHGLGYSLQGNVKTREGRQHPDRDAQFRYIARQVRAAQRRQQPAISVDTKKKELVGPFKNGGRAWRPAKTPQRVRVHDFVIPGADGRARPFRTASTISIGMKAGSAWASTTTRRPSRCGRFAAGGSTWAGRCIGTATSLLITADAGGSNGARLRLWKWELQQLANRTGLAITVCHFPPGTSKWNKIEHRLFSHIAMNWRGTPLVDLATIVSLIGSTHSEAGLHVRAELDRGQYPAGVAVTDAQMATVRLERHRFHGDWNYTIHPATPRMRSHSYFLTGPKRRPWRVVHGRARELADNGQ